MKLIKPSFRILTDEEQIKTYPNHIEICGRKCYQSQHAITEDSAKDFAKIIMDKNHESVIEHCVISVEFICDRGVSHEIVRHRIGSYSQESTRYCNYTKGKFEKEITCIDMSGVFKFQRTTKYWTEDKVAEAMKLIIEAYHFSQYAYNKLSELGLPPELARNVLPTGLKTDIVVTFNIREWRHFFKLRTAETAHPSMRELTIGLYKEFQRLLPMFFGEQYEN